LASLRAIADYVLVLRDGGAVFAGSLAELEASPDPYLRQFLSREAGDQRLTLHQPADPVVRAALDKWLAS
ncbi:MAG: ABC transporter ATP-binding protein, partial [Desulfovibrio fairfieldensis]|nr:ABC transporter ATP-binding protein [Desulfovibrio fairfieldensis]